MPQARPGGNSFANRHRGDGNAQGTELLRRSGAGKENRRREGGTKEPTVKTMKRTPDFGVEPKWGPAGELIQLQGFAVRMGSPGMKTRVVLVTQRRPDNRQQFDNNRRDQKPTQDRQPACCVHSLLFKRSLYRIGPRSHLNFTLFSPYCNARVQLVSC